jgi:hypothetical protein
MNPSNIAVKNPGEQENMFAILKHTNIETICSLNNKKCGSKTLLVPKTSMKVADIVFSEDDVLVFNSKFDKILKFYFSQADDAMPKGIIYELGPNSYQEVDCNIAKVPENKFLIFINTSEIDGEVEISLL